MLERLAAALTARTRPATLVTAESCTGGLIAAACTAVWPGRADWFERGFVTYSNDAKTQMLGVPEGLIAEHGAVSEAVARAMAAGALAHSSAGVAVAVTGIAGPGGGTLSKPVGTVWIATAAVGEPTEATLLQATGDRADIRAASVDRALAMLVARCGGPPAP